MPVIKENYKYDISGTSSGENAYGPYTSAYTQSGAVITDTRTTADGTVSGQISEIDFIYEYTEQGDGQYLENSIASQQSTNWNPHATLYKGDSINYTYSSNPDGEYSYYTDSQQMNITTDNSVVYSSKTD